MANIENLRSSLLALKDSSDQVTLRSTLPGLLRDIPSTIENLDLFDLGLELVNRIAEPTVRRTVIHDFIKLIPEGSLFAPLFMRSMETAIIAADAMGEGQHRTHELLKLVHELPSTEEFLDLRRLAWRLALGLPDKPRFNKPSLKTVAWELPKSSDYQFYRRFTLLGVAKELPREAEFLDLYEDAINLALQAIEVIEEPYYRKYALLYIAEELRSREDFPELYRRVVTEARNAALSIEDQFAREHALVEVLKELPKTSQYTDLLMETVEQSLEFFTIRKWLEDVEATDVVDFVLSAEEPGMKESKKNRYSREKYSTILAAELDKFREQLSDVRFIEVLKPYTHVWIQPKRLREAVRKVVAHLEALKDRYHGREIERPVFLHEFHPASAHATRKKTAEKDCISIDLGATHTVIMRKKGKEQPDFISLPSISRRNDSVHLIPTLLGSETNAIGAEVLEENPISNIKQLLLDRNPRGKEYMERFFKTLCQHLKKATVTGGWFSMVSKSMTEVVYLSAPVGFQGYKKAMKEMARKQISGAEIELIEEPLAAAIGYQVVEERDKIVLIIDFGGSTLNTMIVRVNVDEIHVVAKPERALMLGGHDIDHWLAEHLAEKSGLATETLPYRLLTQAEEIKIELSRKNEVPFEWEGRHICAITREELEDILDQHEFYKNVDRTISNVLKKAEKVGVRKDRIESVLMTGGSSLIPSFRDKIGHVFPELRRHNLIYDHSPFTAVALGAALYGTKEISDRHLSMAYAVRHTSTDPDTPFTYSIVLEKGDSLPLERTFKISASHKLGLQSEIDLQLFEVPENLVVRRWVAESGVEYIRQELQQTKDVQLSALKTLTLAYDVILHDEVEITLHVTETGQLSVGYGAGRNRRLDAGILLR
ncbi:MAG: Hsp70 family protein [Nitrospirota bacterium]|nr:Hsp70 family protein [Nitrospirota bacterium]